MAFAGEWSNILTAETSICCDILRTDLEGEVVQNCPKAENFSAYFSQGLQE